MRFCTHILAGCITIMLITGCGSSKSTIDSVPAAKTSSVNEYVIGPGDNLQIFVWQHPDVSVTIPVRPDGRISTPLIEDMQAVGKTPSQLARDMEAALSEFIRSPTVNVIVTGFIGTFDMQIRVVGQAALPQAIPYKDDMTLLDVMIAVGGLSENASGNRSKIIRKQNGKTIEIQARIKDLLNDGKISANIKMQPGDIVIIPKSWL